MPEIFDESGPVHLLDSFDWKNDVHQTSLAASAVQGVYSLERGRQQGCTDPEHDAHATPWWEQFHFKLIQVLEDDHDSSYFGAIFKLKFFHRLFHRSRPKYVIAFRGTLLTRHTILEDLKLIYRLYSARLQESSRFQTALKAVRDIVEAAGPERVWLAGHSLGAAIAMLAGKNMAKSGYHLQTYLFNPPLISLPIELLIHNKRFAGSLTNATITPPVVALYEWTPYVFVNPNDPFCAEWMKKIGGGVTLAKEDALASLVSEWLERDTEPLPSVTRAYMRVNISHSNEFWLAHGIVQWWQPDLRQQSSLFKLITR